MTIDPSQQEPGPGEQPFRLDADWGMSLDDWNQFERNLHFDNREQFDSTAFIVDVPDSIANDEDLYRLIYLTRHSLDSLKYGGAELAVFVRADAVHLDKLELLLEAKTIKKKDLERFEWVCFVGIGDAIFPDLLSHIGGRVADLVVFDQVFVREDRCFPMLFGEFDPIKASWCDYLNGRFVIRAKFIESAGSSSPIEVLRQVPRSITSEHLALPMLRVNNVSSFIETPSFSTSVATIDGTSIECSGVEDTVSVIVSTKNATRVLSHTLPVIHDLDQVKEIIVVSNQTDNAYSLHLLDQIKKLEKVAIIHYDESFNFSKQSNLAAALSTSKNLLFLNDDVIPSDKFWLHRLSTEFRKHKSAVVGPLLLYPNGTVQHAGLSVTDEGDVEHRYKGCSFPQGSYNYDLLYPSRVWALTGAVILISKSLFDDLNGFDENLATGWQDVDMCLRAREIGAEIILEPRSIMTHLESISILQDLESGSGTISHSQRSVERQLFIDRWKPFPNRIYSPRLAAGDSTCRTLVLNS